MTKVFRYFFLAAALFSVAACDKSEGDRVPDWEWPDPTPKPDPTPDPGKPDEPKSEKPFYIWIDAAANFPDFANSRENIRRDLAKAKEAGFTDVVVDVRPTDGNVLFKSSVGTPVKYLGARISGVYTKVERTADWDYLQAFIEEGHSLGLRVHAAMNTMVGGRSTGLGRTGILFDDASKKDWATVLNLQTGLTNALDAGESTVFFNPGNPEVQEYLLSLIRDLASYEGLDGIFLDRCRYDGMQSDFSQLSKEQFLEYSNLLSIRWPDDVVPVGAKYDDVQQGTLPKYFKLWLEYRAKTIHDFVEKASDAVHQTNPDVKFGVYVGGWYSQYYDVGVNWASPTYNAAAFFSRWASSGYKDYGYADHCDQMLIGAYANPGSVYGTREWTMQGFCLQAKDKIGTACPLVCGGPDVGNWDSGNKYSQDQENQAIVNSVKACYDACDGYFLFDMIHLKQADQWQYAKEGIDIALSK